VAVVGAVQITGNTKTKDVVIRRQLRLRPGMIITQGLLRRDYERLNNLGFFEKVDLNPKPGPDPKKPYEVTLDWNVKEQRTGTAQVGAGYSGGPTGQGLDRDAFLLAKTISTAPATGPRSASNAARAWPMRRSRTRCRTSATRRSRRSTAWVRRSSRPTRRTTIGLRRVDRGVAGSHRTRRLHPAAGR
jgi:hypothetical protein